MSRNRPHVSKRLRAYIFARDGYQCVFVYPDGERCRIQGSAWDYSLLTIEHIIPVWLGGGNAEGNLETMCRSHNHQRDLEMRKLHAKKLPKQPQQERVVRPREPSTIRVIDVVAGGRHLFDTVDPTIGFCPKHGRWQNPRQVCPGCPY